MRFPEHDGKGPDLGAALGCKKVAVFIFVALAGLAGLAGGAAALAVRVLG